jgi:hypothetical protein
MKYLKLNFGDNLELDNQIFEIIKLELLPELVIEKFLLLIGADKNRYTIFCVQSDKKIVSINIFFVLKFEYKSKVYKGYQSGFSATLNEFKGRNIWTKLMEFAEIEIGKIDNSFIVGYPNEKSLPLFINKLSYHCTYLANYLLIPYRNIFSFGLLEDLKLSGNFIQANYSDLMMWKKNFLISHKLHMFMNKYGEVCYSQKPINIFLLDFNINEVVNLKSQTTLSIENLLTNLFNATKSLIFITLPLDFKLSKFYKIKYKKPIPFIYKKLSADFPAEIPFLVFNLTRDQMN